MKWLIGLLLLCAACGNGIEDSTNSVEREDMNPAAGMINDTVAPVGRNQEPEPNYYDSVSKTKSPDSNETNPNVDQ